MSDPKLIDRLRAHAEAERRSPPAMTNSTDTPFIYNVMRTEVVADCYHGDNCDQVRTLFSTYCDGDKDSCRHSDDLVIELSGLPAGAVITVGYPCCPKCAMPREGKFAFTEGRMKIVGFAEICDCGFDWESWVRNKYS